MRFGMLTAGLAGLAGLAAAVAVPLAAAAQDGGPAAAPPRVAAYDPQPFAAAAFDRAQAEGRPVLIETYAEWCLACRVQEPILTRLLAEPRFAGVQVFRIGMLSPEAAWRRFRLDAYGTLVVFKGKRELARANTTSEAALERLLVRAL